MNGRKTRLADVPGSTRVFPVSTEALTRVAKVFECTSHRTLDVRLRFDTRALCSTWPQGRAQKDDTWHRGAAQRRLEQRGFQREVGCDEAVELREVSRVEHRGEPSYQRLLPGD